jgi:hypothetical protein
MALGATVNTRLDMSSILQEWESRSLGKVIVSRLKAWWAKTTPDPWTEEVDRGVRDPEALAVCHHCLTPQETTSWFCPNCRAAVGPYNNLDPYLRICSIGEAARAATGRHIRVSFLTVGGSLGMVLVSAPYLCPFFAWRLYGNCRRIRKLDEAATQPEAQGDGLKPAP